MGISNLWQLVSCVGRRIDLEALEGKTLAIDASIWLIQFMKAMRDEQGKMLPYAHLRGMVHRVCKLLYHGIRPVFVFDGQTPMLKRRTIMKRRQKREDQHEQLRHTAQRLFLNQLKQQQKSKSTKVGVAGYVNTFQPPPGAKEKEEEKEKLLDEEEEKGQCQSSEEEEELDELEQGPRESNFDDRMNIDGHFIPVAKHQQKEYFIELERQQRQDARKEFLVVAGDPEEYSKTQLDQFLKRSKLKQTITNLREQVAGTSGDVTHAKELTGARRIASNANLSYRYISGTTTKVKKNKTTAAEEDRFKFDDQTKVRKAPDEHVKSGSKRQTVLSLADYNAHQLMDQSNDEEIEEDERHDSHNYLNNVYSDEVSFVPTEKEGNMCCSFYDNGKGLAVAEAKLFPAEMFMEPSTSLKDEMVHEEESDSDIEWEGALESPTIKDTVTTQPKELVTVKEEEEDHLIEWECTPESPPKNKKVEEQDDLLLTSPQQPRRSVPHQHSTEQALEKAITTASNIAQWAGGAVRKAIAEHRKEQQDTSPQKSSGSSRSSSPSKPAMMDTTTPPENISQDLFSLASASLMNDAIIPTQHHHHVAKAEETKTNLPAEAKVKAEPFFSTTPFSSNNEQPPETQAMLLQEELQLKQQMNRNQRDMDGLISDEMLDQVMSLLQLFGVPYLVSPMEAEAQCVALEKLHLVDGIITDDSDVFAFGGQKIYKNIFTDSRFVEAYHTRDVVHELGLGKPPQSTTSPGKPEEDEAQEAFIALALLLGSDYTPGIRGVGIVNAVEILNAFPAGLHAGLRDFRDWVHEFEPLEELEKTHEKKRSSEALEDMTATERFKTTHRHIRRKWIIDEASFPNPHVIQAYLKPDVDASTQPFTWSCPDFPGLSRVMDQIFGSTLSSSHHIRMEHTLRHLQQKLESTQASRRQLSMDSFLVQRPTTYGDGQIVAKIQSKRLRRAVKELSTRSDRSDG